MWEYKVWSEGLRARMDDTRYERELNRFGAEGWELVAADNARHVFKRPRTT
jgi:hypothetical protein